MVEEVVEAPRASCSLAGSVCHAVDEYVETLPKDFSSQESPAL
jgi:hypothetical protein